MPFHITKRKQKKNTSDKYCESVNERKVSGLCLHWQGGVLEQCEVVWQFCSEQVPS